MDGSCYSDDGTDDIQISSSSNEAPANPAGIVPLLPQSSKPQANQRVRSKRPEPPGEFLMRRLDVNVQPPCKKRKRKMWLSSHFFNQVDNRTYMWLRQSFFLSLILRRNF